MMMKRYLGLLCAAALCFTAAGCGSSSESSTAESSLVKTNGIQVTASDEVDSGCADCIKAYFEAIEEKDYEKYLKYVYPPYREAYDKLLEKDETDPRDDFQMLCKRFDEDGYDSWTLTDLTLSYYENESTSIDKWFENYVRNDFFDEEFAEECKKSAEEIHDVIFSLSALYSGDEEPVTVVSGTGILTIKNADGWFIFG